MKHLKKILALVLVMAMTFTMLPVFAAAEDAAVETVAPVAEAPAAEAPAVEDVAVIPETAPAEAPAVEAIETVAAEAVPVKAELQALEKGNTTFADDAAAVAAGKEMICHTGNHGAVVSAEFEGRENALDICPLCKQCPKA